MRETISFFVVGDPKGQPRVKACKRGAFTGVYTPDTADEWKKAIKVDLHDNWDGKQFEGPVMLFLDFFFKRPKSHMCKKGLKETAPSKHTSRPDADNLAKAVMDALGDAGLFRDDAQVSHLVVQKGYSDSDITGVQIIFLEDN